MSVRGDSEEGYDTAKNAVSYHDQGFLSLQKRDTTENDEDTNQKISLAWE